MRVQFFSTSLAIGFAQTDAISDLPTTRYKTMRKYGPWTIKETNHIYQDPYVSLKVDQVIRPDGAPGQHVVVQIKAGVCVIAMDAQRRLHLTREFHYAVGRESVEGVSGGIEPGEDPLSCARRELQEEVGLHANNWQHLTTVDPFTTIMQSPTRLYLATELSPVPQTLEGTETIETVVMPIDQAVEAIESGLITHSPTCVAILLVNRRVKAV